MARRKTTQHAVLLHGLARTNPSMGRLATQLRGRGYRVHNLDYPSTARTSAVLADQ
ncbi:MAG: alpha/beta hydrolase, partial [Candidatus Marinimicrobia bacterium]|nr:alpha/beta hydrolase [Candidatus Neomarinimicrobiota bacterium]